MSRPLLVLRLIAPAVLLLSLALTSVGPAAATAAGTGDTEAVIAQRFAEARSQAGLPAVPRSSDLDAVARDWARRQAADGQMKHNPQLREQVQPARSWYENVGHLRGVPSSRTYREAGARLHEMWMDSDGHRANILRTPLTDVGIGVAASGDEVYATVVLRDRGDADAEPSPPREREPEPEPSRAAEPEPAPREAEPPAEAASAPSEPPPGAEASPDAAEDGTPDAPAVAGSADEAAAEVAASEASGDGAEPRRDRAPADLARQLERRGGVTHDEPEAERPEDEAALGASGRAPVELLVLPDAAVELPVDRPGSRAVPVVFGLTTVAAAVVIGAGRSRRGGR